MLLPFSSERIRLPPGAEYVHKKEVLEELDTVPGGHETTER